MEKNTLKIVCIILALTTVSSLIMTSIQYIGKQAITSTLNENIQSLNEATQDLEDLEIMYDELNQTLMTLQENYAYSLIIRESLYNETVELGELISSLYAEIISLNYTIDSLNEDIDFWKERVTYWQNLRDELLEKYEELAGRDQLMIPLLISPQENATMDNGRTDYLDPIIWDFNWTGWDQMKIDAYLYPLKYQLYVIGSTASIPIINATIQTNSTYHFESWAYVSTGVTFNWKVRAYVLRYIYTPNATSVYEWGPWSETRRFTVEPVNTDPPI